MTNKEAVVEVVASRLTGRRTMKWFVAVNKIRMTAEWTDSNPAMEDSRDMDHWKCVLKMGNKQSLHVRNVVARLKGHRIPPFHIVFEKLEVGSLSFGETPLPVTTWST